MLEYCIQSHVRAHASPGKSFLFTQGQSNHSLWHKKCVFTYFQRLIDGKIK